MSPGKSWLEISGEHLAGNYRTLRDAASSDGPEIPVLAVIKAAAYGHGAERCAPVLAAAGAPWLGVTDAAEGAAVRQALSASAHQPGILVMCGSLPEDASTIAQHRLTPVLWAPEQIDSVARAATAAAPIPVHLEIDTGMSRQGVTPGPALEKVLDHLAGAPALSLDGVLTHFASAEIAGSPLTGLQQTRFESALAQIAARGLRPQWVHAGNSSTIDERSSLPWLRRVAFGLGARPLLRSGLALYGHCLPLEGAPGSLRTGLAPVLTWKCRILALTDLAPGATVGYNATHTTPRPTRLALLPIGYADGLRRELSASNDEGGGWVIIRNLRAPILGRVSMNLTAVDVTSIPEITLADEVTVLGPGITADDHARLARTIPYEILCGLRASPQILN